MSRQDELDFRCAQRFHYIEILFAGNAEDAFDALILERADQEIGTLRHCSPLLFSFSQCFPAPRILARPARNILQHQHRG